MPGRRGDGDNPLAANGAPVLQVVLSGGTDAPAWAEGLRGLSAPILR